MNESVDQSQDFNLHCGSDCDSKVNVLWLNDCQGVARAIKSLNVMPI